MKKSIIILFFLLIFSKNLKAVEPVFNYIDSDWLQPISQDMSDFWAMAGLQETGMNYYSSASGDPYWERFNPLNPRYQAWFGCYVVNNFEFASDWPWGKKKRSAKRAIELTIADQVAWLTYAGNPLPYPELVEESVYYYPVGKGWYKVHYILESGSDFGVNTPFPFCPAFADYSDIINPYHDIILYCSAKFKYDIENGQFLVIYKAVGQYQLKDGTWKYPTWEVVKEINKMRRNVSFE